MTKNNFVYENSNFLKINKYCNLAHRYSAFYCIAGFAGAGKTFALNQYTKNNSGTILLTLGKSTSPRDLFNELLNEFRNESIYRSESKGFLKRLIMDEIDAYDKKGLIIIDETGQIEGSKLPYIKEIRDMTSTKFGLILSAHKDFLSHSINWKRKGKVGVEELISRIYSTVTLKRPTDGEIREYFEFVELKSSQMKHKLLNDALKQDIEDRSWRAIWQSITLQKMNENQS